MFTAEPPLTATFLQRLPLYSRHFSFVPALYNGHFSTMQRQLALAFAPSEK